MIISKVNLSLAMLRANLSNGKDLSLASGISINTVSRIMNGYSISLKILQKVAIALNCNPEDLIDKEVN